MKGPTIDNRVFVFSRVGFESNLSCVTVFILGSWFTLMLVCRVWDERPIKAQGTLKTKDIVFLITSSSRDTGLVAYDTLIVINTNFSHLFHTTASQTGLSIHNPLAAIEAWWLFQEIRDKKVVGRLYVFLINCHLLLRWKERSKHSIHSCKTENMLSKQPVRMNVKENISY